MASSMPGICGGRAVVSYCMQGGGGRARREGHSTAKARSCIMPPMPPRPPPAASAASSPWPASRSCMLPLGSISMALRLSKPSTRRASLPNFWLKASDRLWGRVRGDEQHAAAHPRHLDGQRARRRRLAHAALAAHEDPPAASSGPGWSAASARARPRPG